MADFRDLAQRPEHRRGFERLLYLAAQRGDVDLVLERLGWGIDPDCRLGRGRTPLIGNVRGTCPSVGVVRALLAAGADAGLMDEAGLSALDYARRKLMRLMQRTEVIPPLAPPFEGGGSKSLDENGQLALGAEEQAEVDRMREEGGAEFARVYWRERLRAARRVFDSPREVEGILELLERAGEVGR